MNRSWPLAPAAALLALAACAGCAVDQAKETALYRGVLDARMPAPGPDIAPADVLTLEQALALTNRRNEQLGLSGEDYVQALIDRDKAVAAFFPKIDLRPSHAVLEHFIAPAPASLFVPNPVTDVPLHTEWNVFNGFRDLAAVEQADVIAKYRLSLLENLQAQTLLSAAQVYYQILRLEQQVRVLTNSVTVQEARVADIRARVKAGVARPLDLAQTEAEASATRAALIDARSKVVTARSGLAFLIGATSLPNPLADQFEVPERPALQEMHDTAAARRPDLLAAATLVDATGKGLKAAYGQYLPSVTIDFDYFLHKTSFPADSLWAFGVGVNIPLFHGGRIEADVRRAYSLVRQAQLYESLTRRQVIEQVDVAYENLRASEERLAELQVQVRASRDAFGLATQSYDVGLATNLERLIAQDRVLQAELQLVAEQLNRKILYLNLVEAVGALVDEVAKLPGATVTPQAPTVAISS